MLFGLNDEGMELLEDDDWLHTSVFHKAPKIQENPWCFVKWTDFETQMIVSNSLFYIKGNLAVWVQP